MQKYTDSADWFSRVSSQRYIFVVSIRVEVQAAGVHYVASVRGIRVIHADGMIPHSDVNKPNTSCSSLAFVGTLDVVAGGASRSGR